MITAVVLARDEAATIERCLRALAWADARLVLLDAATTDDTAARAEALGARVVARPFSNFADQRNAALELVAGEWVLFVDADEVVSAELAAEIRAVTEATPDPPGPGEPTAGYWIPRRNFICGRWVRGAGWYPDEQLRLLRCNRASYDRERLVHELVVLDGAAGHLTEPLIHYNYENLVQFRRKQARYAALEALTLYQGGLKPRPRSLLAQPLREFRRRYLTLGGYREGVLGFQLCLLLAWATFQTYWWLFGLWRQEGRGRTGSTVTGLRSAATGVQPGSTVYHDHPGAPS
jgi:glycosyltransferase involved in cell wall biosynthesis